SSAFRGWVVEGVRLINLTPHEITIYTDRGAVSIPPSGQVSRIGDVPINRVGYGGVEEEGFEDSG
ncbi:MAG: hypothetical protein QXG25_05305, partial [Nitrososphaerota archaeon]